jgi:hypothetical protein
MPPPAGSSAGVGNMYYSFDYGLVHWVVIDTEVDYPGAPEGQHDSHHIAQTAQHAVRWQLLIHPCPAPAVLNEGPGTYLSSGTFGLQLPWLQADLAQAVANRKTVPWIVVVGHRPYYSSDQDDTQASSQRAFESLFIENSVDVVFWYEAHSTPPALSAAQLPAADPLRLPCSPVL